MDLLKKGDGEYSLVDAEQVGSSNLNTFHFLYTAASGKLNQVFMAPVSAVAGNSDFPGRRNSFNLPNTPQFLIVKRKPNPRYYYPS